MPKKEVWVPDTAQTNTSKLRTQGIKLTCYVNTEVDHGRSTAVHLPTVGGDAVDTLEEVLPYVQKRMHLDRYMKYAETLYLPDGVEIKEWEQLTDASARDIPIIVCCGEPFEPSTIPAYMLAFQQHGGGPSAHKLENRDRLERDQKVTHKMAAKVKATGHGTSSVAVRTARAKKLQQNREVVADCRHEFMENLLMHSQKQEAFIKKVKQRNEKSRVERDARREKMKQLANQTKELTIVEQAREDDRLARESDAKADKELRKEKMEERKEAARQRVFENIEKRKQEQPLERLIQPRVLMHPEADSERPSLHISPQLLL